MGGGCGDSKFAALGGRLRGGDGEDALELFMCYISISIGSVGATGMTSYEYL